MTFATCPECNGHGYLVDFFKMLNGPAGVTDEALCPVCEGSGEVAKQDEPTEAQLTALQWRGVV